MLSLKEIALYYPPPVPAPRPSNSALIFDHIKGYTYQEKINTLSNCNCCPRHQINKPNKFGKYIEKGPSLKKCLLQDKRYKCLCKCRNESRWICRIYANECKFINPIYDDSIDQSIQKYP